MNAKLNYKSPVVFCNPKNYDLHLINNKLIFIDSIRFLISSLYSLVKNLVKGGFNFLSQEFENNVLELVKQKRFYPYEYMSDFENIKKQ